MAQGNGVVEQAEAVVGKSAERNAKAKKERVARVKPRAIKISGNTVQVLVGKQVAITLTLQSEAEVKEFVWQQLANGPLTVALG